MESGFRRLFARKKSKSKPLPAVPSNDSLPDTIRQSAGHHGNPSEKALTVGMRAFRSFEKGSKSKPSNHVKTKSLGLQSLVHPSQIDRPRTAPGKQPTPTRPLDPSIFKLRSTPSQTEMQVSPREDVPEPPRLPADRRDVKEPRYYDLIHATVSTSKGQKPSKPLRTASDYYNESIADRNCLYTRTMTLSSASILRHAQSRDDGLYQPTKSLDLQRTDFDVMRSSRGGRVIGAAQLNGGSRDMAIGEWPPAGNKKPKQQEPDSRPEPIRGKSVPISIPRYATEVIMAVERSAAEHGRSSPQIPRPQIRASPQVSRPVITAIGSTPLMREETMEALRKVSSRSARRPSRDFGAERPRTSGATVSTSAAYLSEPHLTSLGNKHNGSETSLVQQKPRGLPPRNERIYIEISDKPLHGNVSTRPVHMRERSNNDDSPRQVAGSIEEGPIIRVHPPKKIVPVKHFVLDLTESQPTGRSEEMIDNGVGAGAREVDNSLKTIKPRKVASSSEIRSANRLVKNPPSITSPKASTLGEDPGSVHKKLPASTASDQPQYQPNPSHVTRRRPSIDILIAHNALTAGKTPIRANSAAVLQPKARSPPIPASISSTPEVITRDFAQPQTRRAHRFGNAGLSSLDSRSTAGTTDNLARLGGTGATVKRSKPHDYHSQSADIDQMIATKKEAAARALMKLQDVMKTPIWEEPEGEQVRPSSSVSQRGRKFSLEEPGPPLPKISSRAREVEGSWTRADLLAASVHEPKVRSKKPSNQVKTISTSHEKVQDCPSQECGASGEISTGRSTPNKMRSRMGSTFSTNSGMSAYSVPSHMVPGRASSLRSSPRASLGDFNPVSTVPATGAYYGWS